MNENYFKRQQATGVNIDIKCGFVPGHVRVVNITSATGDELQWFRGMADASSIKIAGGVRSKITTLGITPLGDTANETMEQGFRIGTDAAVNINTNEIIIIAYRGGEGNQF